MSLGKTPWVDKNVRNAWNRIAEQVPASWMPNTTPGKKFELVEYGCGHYGCVTPTNEPGLVFKLTSDVTEAKFVTMAATLPPTDGIVKYEKIFALRGMEHRGRPLFVLWREAAKDIGLLSAGGHFVAGERYGYDSYQERSLQEGKNYLYSFLNWGHEIREKTIRLLKHAPREKVLEALWRAFEDADPEADPRYYKGVPRLGIALSKCYGLAMLLQNTDVVYPVGAALGHYMDEGILLADVHFNNVGRDENNQLLITDPGHAVEFHPRWNELPKVPII